MSLPTKENSGILDNLTSVFFTTPTKGFITTSGTDMLTTSNGGISWTQISQLAPSLSKVYFVDVNHGWAVGAAGAVLSTNNGGLTWFNLYPGTSETLNSVYFVSPTIGWISGGKGLIKRTTDGGNTWSTQSSGNTSYIYSLFFLSANKGWAAGSDGTLLNYYDPNPDVSVTEREKKINENLIYPNPANEVLVYSLNSLGNQSYAIQVTDQLGRTVYSETSMTENGLSEHTLDVDAFKNGSYLMTIQLENGKTQCTRFVKCD